MSARKCKGCGYPADCHEGLCFLCRIENDEALAESLERALEAEARRLSRWAHLERSDV